VLEPGRTDAPLQCRLEVVSIDTPGRYEAISYVWGNKEPSGNVICDSKCLQITRNLEDALLQVRLRDCPRVIWADAICIDQRNVDERGHQVKLMQHIYSRADRVLVWLGRDTHHSSARAFALVDMIYRFARKEVTVTDARIPLPDDPAWQLISNLFDCAWFWRLWVIQ
jgi:hypothetical protein